MNIDTSNPPKDQAGYCQRCGKKRLWVGENKALNCLASNDDGYICVPCGCFDRGENWSPAP
jgi:hypothetical protein